ncbi:MAG: DUF3783 domain-containing protein [Acidaminococcaceae bacterium]|nr:DUF3783 domain-containing protein [Acidaminococcaceae bacterium]
MNKIILAYNFTEARMRSLRVLCAMLKVQVRTVAKADMLQPVGYLLGLEGIAACEEKFSGAGCAEEMILMCGFDKLLLNRFLSSVKKSKLGSIKLKAMLTAHNVAWSGKRLQEELREENAYMEKRGTLSFHVADADVEKN